MRPECYAECRKHDQPSQYIDYVSKVSIVTSLVRMRLFSTNNKTYEGWNLCESYEETLYFFLVISFWIYPKSIFGVANTLSMIIKLNLGMEGRHDHKVFTKFVWNSKYQKLITKIWWVQVTVHGSVLPSTVSISSKFRHQEVSKHDSWIENYDQ